MGIGGISKQSISNPSAAEQEPIPAFPAPPWPLLPRNLKEILHRAAVLWRGIQISAGNEAKAQMCSAEEELELSWHWEPGLVHHNQIKGSHQNLHGKILWLPGF